MKVVQELQDGSQLVEGLLRAHQGLDCHELSMCRKKLAWSQRNNSCVDEAEEHSTQDGSVGPHGGHLSLGQIFRFTSDNIFNHKIRNYTRINMDEMLITFR